jgi:biopolymer transport protein ExbD
MKFHRPRRTPPLITIVPLIDILTILLIFFIATTVFKSQQAQVVIELPSVKTAVAKANEAAPAILAINKEGEVFLEGEPLALSEVGAAYKKLEEAHRALALKADEKASYGRVLEVLDALRLAGAQNLPAFTKPQ